jgi:hypothetical protein
MLNMGESKPLMNDVFVPKLPITLGRLCRATRMESNIWADASTPLSVTTKNGSKNTKQCKKNAEEPFRMLRHLIVIAIFNDSLPLHPSLRGQAERFEE